jgi:hypothetical protein
MIEVGAVVGILASLGCAFIIAAGLAFRRKSTSRATGTPGEVAGGSTGEIN